MNRLIGLLPLVLLSTSMHAQSVAGLGGISGTVSDASGARVPGAEVLISNAEKGVHRSLTTNAAGIFNAGSLVPASGYLISVTKAGFAKNDVRYITLQVGQLLNVNLTLNVTSSSTPFEVCKDAPGLASTNKAVS